MADIQSMVIDSRPTTAHSDTSFATALERPVSFYPVGSVNHGIDHIISLLSRSQRSSHRHSASIASQASIERGTFQPKVPTAHILHELELLKQLVDHEQLRAHDGQIAALGDESEPTYETDGQLVIESKPEAGDLDPELAIAREGLLLRAAERMVNSLTSENMSLQHAFRNHAEEMEAMKAQKESVDATLQTAQASIAELREQLRQLQGTARERQDLIDSLRSDKQRADSAYEDVRSTKNIAANVKDKISQKAELLPQVSISDFTSRDAASRRSKGKSLERSRSATPKSGRLPAVNIDIEKQLAEVELLLIDLEGKKARNDALAKQVEDYQAKLAAANRAHEAAEQRSKEAEVTHAQEMQTMQAQLQAERQKSSTALISSPSSQTRAFENQKTAQSQEVARLQIEHAEQISVATREHETQLTAKGKELQKSEERGRTLERRIQELSAALGAHKVSEAGNTPADASKSDAEMADTERKEASINGLELDRRSGQAEVRNLKKRHQEAIAQIRATAQRQLENQRLELEERHQAAIAVALADAHRASAGNQSTEASAQYQSESSRLEGEHRLKMAELETKHQEKITLELLIKEDAIRSETKALQDRLDASLTGQAEAERAIALFRQQKLEADKRIAEAEASFQKQLEAVQREKDSLSDELKDVQASLEDLQRKPSHATGAPSNGSNQELRSAKVQVVNLEKSRAETKALWQKALEEKSELIRQNDFLVKELEALLTQRSKPRLPNVKSKDAQIQTDDWPSEPKVDAMSMKEWKAERQNGPQPTTPISATYQQAREEIETAWKSRTFEAYLQSAHAEFPNLERVNSANEALFAEKLHEHLKEVQDARHRMAMDYQNKLEILASEKDQMDQMVTLSHITAFAEEQERLLAGCSPTINSSTAHALPGIPLDDKRGMRRAEQRLIQEFDRRLVERKSQIALQYAARFQEMTQEYDQEIARLLYDGQPPRVSPATYHQHSPISTKSPRIDSDSDSSKSPMTPDRASLALTSTPRSFTSIPRAVMFPGNRHSPDATSQPRSIFKLHRNWNSVTQHSLMRAKSPAGMLTTPSSVTSDKSSDSKSVVSPLRDHSTNDSEQTKPATKAPTRLSMESSIPRPGIPTRARERRSMSPTNPLRTTNSKRLSSGMIYYQAPRQSVVNPS